jgi:hypothetical protein
MTVNVIEEEVTLPKATVVGVAEEFPLPSWQLSVMTQAQLIGVVTEHAGEKTR